MKEQDFLVSIVIIRVGYVKGASSMKWKNNIWNSNILDVFDQFVIC